jgi:hypothetical protein
MGTLTMCKLLSTPVVLVLLLYKFTLANAVRFVIS